MNTVSIFSPAKINLTLDVGKKRQDGYHDVKMIMQSVNLYDTVKVTASDKDEIVIKCNHLSVPLDKSNLVYKACDLFFNGISLPRFGLCIEIDKKIPVQAGLAGGSTDCAGALIAMNILTSSKLSIDTLAQMGAKLGSDVPFCLYGGTMLAEGRGTELLKVHDMPDCHIILVKPDIGISTAYAYSMIDSNNKRTSDSSAPALEALDKGDFKKLCKSLSNDFENVTNLKEISDIKMELLTGGALGACMSGSGPTVFGLFDDTDKAKFMVQRLSQKYKEVYLCKPCKSGCTENQPF